MKVRHKFLKTSRFKKVKNFIKTVYITAKTKIKSFIKGVYEHTESIIVLSLAALGLNALLGELPFMYVLPLWIEGVMIIPVISVVSIYALMQFAEWRSIRRNHRMVLA